MKTKHFEERAKQRFGKKFNKRQEKFLLNKIKTMKPISQRGNTLSYELKYDNKQIRLVLDVIENKLITIIEIAWKDHKQKEY